MTTQPQTIETALADIAKLHDVTTVTLSFRPNSVGPEYAWDVGFHWDGYSRTNNPYTSQWGATPAIAMARALTSMKLIRTPLSFSDATVDFAVAA